jgi:hypothetical protein
VVDLMEALRRSVEDSGGRAATLRSGGDAKSSKPRAPSRRRKAA